MGNKKARNIERNNKRAEMEAAAMLRFRNRAVMEFRVATWLLTIAAIAVLLTFLLGGSVSAETRTGLFFGVFLLFIWFGRSIYRRALSVIFTHGEEDGHIWRRIASWVDNWLYVRYYERTKSGKRIPVGAWMDRLALWVCAPAVLIFWATLPVLASEFPASNSARIVLWIGWGLGLLAFVVIAGAAALRSKRLKHKRIVRRIEAFLDRYFG